MNYLFFINSNSIYTLMTAIKRLKLAKPKALADLDKPLYLKIEPKKL